MQTRALQLLAIIGIAIAFNANAASAGRGVDSMNRDMGPFKNSMGSMDGAGATDQR